MKTPITILAIWITYLAGIYAIGKMHLIRAEAGFFQFALALFGVFACFWFVRSLLYNKTSPSPPSKGGFGSKYAGIGDIAASFAGLPTFGFIKRTVTFFEDAVYDADWQNYTVLIQRRAVRFRLEVAAALITVFALAFHLFALRPHDEAQGLNGVQNDTIPLSTTASLTTDEKQK